MSDPDIHTEQQLVNLELLDKTEVFSKKKNVQINAVASTRISITYYPLVVNLWHLMIILLSSFHSQGFSFSGLSQDLVIYSYEWL